MIILFFIHDALTISGSKVTEEVRAVENLRNARVNN